LQEKAALREILLMAYLEVKDLSKRFGGLVAVVRLDFEIEEGEIVGLIGPNGAGKTTVFNMIAGTFKPTHGEIIFAGTRITGLKSSKIAALGAVRTFQLTNVFGDMSVLENVILGGHCQSGVGLWRSMLGTPKACKLEKICEAEAIKKLKFMGLYEHRDMLAKNLPHGQQRRLEVCIALAAKPTLLLLDEPLQGMNHEEVKTMLEKITEIREEGKTILLVEHNMRAVTTICDKVVVLNFGRKIAEGLPQSVMEDGLVIQAYLGVEE
jgi:branched-chain amino acid transport system ATP-binding protein